MHQRIYLYLLLGAAFLQGPARAAEPGYDFRIVIDVSSSMQQTDPQNLRVDALQLLNGLIPTGSRAGVWTFGRYVDVAVKWGRVDDGWRRQADLDAGKIHANALRTNIENALARASVGWDKADANTTRVLLLLTDGRVEVSADAEKNEKSRKRILTENLAALKKAAVQVHSIALSAATDEALLKRLALETGGSFTVAQRADELPKVFLTVFERATHPHSVALQGREFSIDSSISEMKLLVFRGDDTAPTILIPPDSPAISAQKPRSARWRSGRRYDLITLEKPEAGSWRIDAEMDPDNRLMVTTDLRLETRGIPAYGAPQDVISMSAELFHHERKIRKNSFLRFVDFSLTHIHPGGSETRHAFTHTGLREDKGRFLLQLGPALEEGAHRFVVSASTASFNRSQRFEMQVQRPVEVKIEPRQKPGSYELRLRARDEYLKPDGMVAEVEIEAPDGSSDRLRLEPELGWLRARIDTDQEGTYQARIRISAQNHAREIYDIDLGAFPVLGVDGEPPGATEVEPTLQKTPQSPLREGTDWRVVGIVVVGVNLSLILVIVVVWLMFRRKDESDEFIIDDEEYSG